MIEWLLFSANISFFTNIIGEASYILIKWWWCCLHCTRL